MQLLQNLIITVASVFFTLYLTRKIGLSSSDRDVLKNQFELYNIWYLKIVRNQLGSPVDKNTAKVQIQKLYDVLLTNADNYNLITLELKYYLSLYKNSPSLYVSEIQYQIEKDFGHIKYRLGYPTKLRNERIINNILSIYYVSILWEIVSLFNIFFNHYPKDRLKSDVFFDIFIFIIILIAKYYLLNKESYVRSCKNKFKSSVKLLIHYYKNKIHNHRNKPSNQ